MIIYIAGPISSCPETYKEAFAAAERKLAVQGHEIWNPAHSPEGLPYENYFDVCFAMIRQSDAIYLLKGWYLSPGAVREAVYAVESGKQVLYE